MNSRKVLTLLVVLLTVTAGCMGGGGGDGAGEGSELGDSEVGAANGGDGGDGGDGGASEADEELELTNIETALREAGSFTVTWRYTGVDGQGTETEVSREFYADLDAERSLTVISSMRNGEPDGGSSQQFVTDGITYTRSGPDDSPTYFSYEQSADVVGTAIALSQARAYSADDDIRFRGTETFDGVTVKRYELSRADSELIQAGSAAGAAAGQSNMQITDFQYSVLVDEDGLTRFESWSIRGETSDGQTVTGDWEYTITSVGSTTVDDPDWLAEAKAQRAN